jgi:outer membrane protein OmpA-like peptidoglycan-associated protein
MKKTLLAFSVLSLSACTGFGVPSDDVPKAPSPPPNRLDFSQRYVKPVNQLAQIPTSFEYVAIPDGDNSPRPIAQLTNPDGTWIVFEGAGMKKPTYYEAIAGEGVQNGLIQNVYFDLGSSNLSDDKSVKELAAKLKAISGSILIVGYTDQSGGEKLNRELSSSRANTISEQLVAMGVKQDRIKTKAAGVSRMYATESKNRRASIFLDIQ